VPPGSSQGTRQAAKTRSLVAGKGGPGKAERYCASWLWGVGPVTSTQWPAASRLECERDRGKRAGEECRAQPVVRALSECRPKTKQCRARSYSAKKNRKSPKQRNGPGAPKPKMTSPRRVVEMCCGKGTDAGADREKRLVSVSARRGGGLWAAAAISLPPGNFEKQNDIGAPNAVFFTRPRLPFFCRGRFYPLPQYPEVRR